MRKFPSYDECCDVTRAALLEATAGEVEIVGNRPLHSKGPARTYSSTAVEKAWHVQCVSNAMGDYSVFPHANLQHGFPHTWSHGREKSTTASSGYPAAIPRYP